MTEWKNEHGYCPSCKADLDGEPIWKYFYDRLIEDGYYNNGLPLAPAEAELKADEIASNYGASRTKGKWGREIGLYDWGKDRTVSYKCPDCGHEWGR